MKKILPDGTIVYYVEYADGSALSRDDGPAVIYPNGDKEYWLNGLRLNYSIERGVGDRRIFRKINKETK